MNLQDPAVYRCDPKYFWIGVACCITFGVFGIGSFAIAYWNIDGSFQHPKAAALGFCLFWFTFLLMGAWILCHAVRFRLKLGDDAIEQVGCIRTRTVSWAEISRLRWRLMPNDGGSVVLYARSHRLLIEFGSFLPAHRKEIIHYLRSRATVLRQEGWEAFEKRWLTAPSVAPQWMRAYFMLAGVTLLAFAALFAWVWTLSHEGGRLVMAAANALAGLWCLWRWHRFPKTSTTPPRSRP